MCVQIPTRSARSRRLGEAAAALVLLSVIAVAATRSSLQPKEAPPLTSDSARQQAQARAWLERAKSTGKQLALTAPKAIADEMRAAHPYSSYKELLQISKDLGSLESLQTERERLYLELESATDRYQYDKVEEVQERLDLIDKEFADILNRMQNL